MSGPENPLQGSTGAGARLDSLDGLRGIAALIVGLIFHARSLIDSTFNPFADVPPLRWFQLYGWSMVDLFFVISGFIFARCYLDGWRMRPGVSIASFAIARIARLWPLHLATLAFVAVMLQSWPSTTAENILLSAFFAHVLIDNPTAVLNGPAWSLSVEAICYVLFAAAAFAGSRWLQAMTLAGILIGASCIALVDVWDALIGRGTAGFFAGVVLCRCLPLFARVPLWVLIAGALIPFAVPPDGSALIATVLVAWPCVILIALRSRWLGGPAFTWLGERSYAIYLVHVPVYLVAFALRPAGPVSPLGVTLSLLASWIAIFGIAHWIYSALERPAQRAILDACRRHRDAVGNPKPAP
jgi:peptidoglycan/LPS O-acetylase OafA/YrhL